MRWKSKLMKLCCVAELATVITNTGQAIRFGLYSGDYYCSLLPRIENLSRLFNTEWQRCVDVVALYRQDGRAFSLSISLLSSARSRRRFH